MRSSVQREPPAVAQPDAFGHTERAVLSYGAMYFPWLQADARTGRNGESAANRLDPVAADDDHGCGDRRAAAAVDQPSASYDDRVRRRLAAKQEEGGRYREDLFHAW